jgi:curved DNA-binding protein CbpA
MDAYAMLGVRRGASAAELRRAYLALALRLHPDKGGRSEQFRGLQEAWRVLGDPELRRMLDEEEAWRSDGPEEQLRLSELEALTDAGSGLVVYSRSCRCGDTFKVSDVRAYCGALSHL